MLITLTNREMEVARQVGKGLTNLEIADRLGVTERTVKAHLTVVYEKLMITNRVLLALAVHNIFPTKESDNEM